MFHTYAPFDPVCGVVMTDEDYPTLAAHRLLRKVLDEFNSKYPRSAYNGFVAGDPKLSFPELKDYIKKYQDPENADSTMKIQKELDETKIVLHKTIESVLERGVKIDDLVQKSEGLSAQSKMFYTQVRGWRISKVKEAGTDIDTRLRNKIRAAPLCEHRSALDDFAFSQELIPGFYSRYKLLFIPIIFRILLLYNDHVLLTHLNPPSGK